MSEFEIRRFLDILHPDNDLFEIRVIDGKRTYSGYFTDSEKAYNAIKDINYGNIYLVYNKIHEACYGRTQHDVLMQQPKSTTSDRDITSRQWVLIDIDPVRPSDCNSSTDELKAAKIVCGMVYRYLRTVGFTEPIFGMSGNGYHMLYKTDMPNNPESQKVIKDFLTSIGLMFATDLVGIDQSVFSAAQLTKVLGTVSRKGTDKDPTRPQRQSQIMHVPDRILSNHISLFSKVAELIPQPEKPTYHNNYGKESFDIDGFIHKSGLSVAKDFVSSGVRKILLSECPFDSNHKAPDSALFVMPNGAIGFKCLHSSCAGHKWSDVRILLDRDYTPNRDRNFTRTIQPINRLLPSPEDVLNEDDRGAKFLQLTDIKNLDRSQIIAIPTGFNEIDKQIIGLNKGEVSLISGSNASGKSTFINQICLNAISGGFKASIWSGELTPTRMKNWIHLQAAGRQYTRQSKFSDNSFYVPPSIGDKIDTWLKDSLYIYNNDYGNKFTQLMADLEEHVKEQQVDLLILDNLMAMDILMLDGTYLQQQAKMIIEITNFAKRLNVHLILVAHPRKSMAFLRKNDISGSADLTNAVDNVFIVHRVNNDFVKSSGEFYGSETATRYFSFHNVVEICKNRDLGIQDALIGLFFEIESKRFLNDRFENIVYQWVDMGAQKEIDYKTIFAGNSALKPNLEFEQQSMVLSGDGFEPEHEDEYPF